MYKECAQQIRKTKIDQLAICEKSIIKSQNLGILYKHINSRLTHTVGIALLLNQYGVLVLNDSDNAEVLNKHLINVGKPEDGLCSNITSSNPSQSSMCDVKFYIVEVFKQIKK